MNEPSSTSATPNAAAELLADLRRRLQSSQEQAQATRVEARRLARELRLAHRLLQFSLDGPPPARPAPAVDAAKILRASATLLTAPMRYHLDACENRGAYTAISGWAFCPANGWDARLTVTRILLRHNDTAFIATSNRVARPDVAAYLATQPSTVSGGALGLESVGFACEILNDSLPVGNVLRISLRLECAGLACEQFTGQTLRL